MALDWLTVTMTATNMACYWYIDATFLNFFEIGNNNNNKNNDVLI
jgi:hypothetical protein